MHRLLFTLSSLTFILSACREQNERHPGPLAPDAAPPADAAAGNRFPCASATPWLDAFTGFERCEDGHLRRLAPGLCPSSLPRVDPVPAYDPAVDECERDADCSALALGFCGPREGGTRRVCVQGCRTDQDCATGRVCACDEPAGRCVPATCDSSDDCMPGYDCASTVTGPGCFTLGFACQTAYDGCASDDSAACDGRFANPTFCVYQDGIRQCSTLQCVTQ